MLIFTASVLQQPKPNVPSLYCQGSTLSGIIYVGRIPTMEHDLLYTNIFHQPSYDLQMYEEYILTTTRFPLVYLNETLLQFLPIPHTWKARSSFYQHSFSTQLPQWNTH